MENLNLEKFIEALSALLPPKSVERYIFIEKLKCIQLSSGYPDISSNDVISIINSLSGEDVQEFQ